MTTNTTKVESYSLPGSFLKLEYLKPYAIVKVISNGYRMMINLSISGYFVFGCVSFSGRMSRDHTLLENETIICSFIQFTVPVE